MSEHYLSSQACEGNYLAEREPVIPFTATNASSGQKGKKIKVTLEKIRLSPELFPPSQHISLRIYSKVASSNNDGVIERGYFPREGSHILSEEKGYEIAINKVIFHQIIEDELYIEIGRLEEDTYNADDRIGRYARIFAGCLDNFVGTYGPSNNAFCIEDGDGWKVWYRIEFSK